MGSFSVALTNAERQARHQAHKRGDHSLCPPARECRTGPGGRHRPRTTPALDESAGPGRGAALPQLDGAHGHDPLLRSPRSQRLWAELNGRLTTIDLVLLEETCRLTDRLDRLDRIIDGNDEWLRISTEDGDVIVAVDAALAEARQMATTLRGLITDLKKALPRAPARPGATKGGALGDLQSRIADRRRASAG